MPDHPLLLLAADVTFDDVTKLGLGGVGLLMLYAILKPLIAALIETQKANVITLSAIAQTQIEVRDEIRELRATQRDHMRDDSAATARLVGGDGCRFDPEKHRKVLP